MPSRKRAEGRARKAKGKAKSKSVNNYLSSLGCNHGCPSLEYLPPTQRHLLYAIHEALEDELMKVSRSEENIRCEQAGIILMKGVVEKHPEVLRDDAVREAMKSYILLRGTEDLLGFSSDLIYADMSRKDKSRICFANMMAASFILLRDYRSNWDWGCTEHMDEFMKYKGIFGRSTTNIFRFFRARIPCYCLDKMCEELSNRPDATKDVVNGYTFHALPQPGDGFGKGREYDPDETGPWKCFCSNCYTGGSLEKCDKCQLAWYCSKACQHQHWKTHKVRCKASSGTKSERKKIKKLARRWERENDEELDKEREKITFLLEGFAEQRNFLKWCGGDNSSDESSSDEDEH